MSRKLLRDGDAGRGRMAWHHANHYARLISPASAVLSSIGSLLLNFLLLAVLAILTFSLQLDSHQTLPQPN